MKLAKILYFIEGPLPTGEQQHEAANIRGDVSFRNALAVPEEEVGCLEDCDGVAGKVPDVYAQAFPSANEAVAKYNAKLKAQRDRVGDSAPEQQPTKKERNYMGQQDKPETDPSKRPDTEQPGRQPGRPEQQPAPGTPGQPGQKQGERPEPGKERPQQSASADPWKPNK